MTFPTTFLVVVSVILLTCSGATASETEPLVIETARGSVTFDVEIADDPEERATGLMFRTALPANAGMLFDFGREQDVRMWMKNTLISLDMIFIEGDGRILRIESHTTPYSTRVIESGGPVRAVLELNGGVSAGSGIVPGDRVIHPIFEAQR